MSDGNGQRDGDAIAEGSAYGLDQGRLLAEIARGILMAHARLDDLETRIRASTAEVVTGSVDGAVQKIAADSARLGSAVSSASTSLAEQMKALNARIGAVDSDLTGLIRANDKNVSGVGQQVARTSAELDRKLSAIAEQDLAQVAALKAEVSSKFRSMLQLVEQKTRQCIIFLGVGFGTSALLLAIIIYICLKGA